MADTKSSERPPYYAEAGMVWKRPIKTLLEGGITSISIGFPVCRMHAAVGDDAAEQVAALMNLGAEKQAEMRSAS